MTLTEARPIPLSSSGLVKMEERKRPASYEHEDSAPPQKRQVTAVNGSKSHQDADMPGKDELERFQKEAIWRQMQEYKREKTTLETRLTDLTKRALYHDDHLRTIDAWFNQLLDEVKLLVGKVQDSSSTSIFPSSLLSADNPNFERHLKSRSDAISSAISQLFRQSDRLTPDIPSLQARITQLLSAEKTHLNELEQSRLEKEQLEERLESASMRYMMAEKKLDRAKSMTVAKLERQATAGGRNESGSGLAGGIDGQGSGKVDALNGQNDNSERFVEIESARKEAVAALSVKHEQLEKLAADNEKLIRQVSSFTVKLSTLSDDDYSHTELFKYLRSQHEDVLKRINDLEAINVSLREEAERSQAERTAYRILLEAETQAAVTEKDLLLTQAENDLARVRTGRDELSADLQIRKQAQDQEKASIHHVKQLAAAKEERIKALESEVERLRIHASQSDSLAISTADVDQLPIDELRVKYANIHRQYSMLNQELSSMGTAYKKTSMIASQKIGDASALEEKVMRLTAEKSKADQKYFAAMKTKEARQHEVRDLRAQNSKSSEIVSQLKDSEQSARLLIATHEKIVAETKDALYNMTKQHRIFQQQATEKSIQVENFKAQVDELKKVVGAKDDSMVALSSLHRNVEVEAVEIKIKLEETKKSLESWKAKGLGNQTGEYEMLRNLAICTVCRKNFKDTAVKTCGHVFCRDCVEERLQSRMRKCPNCNKAFGANDHMRITL